jgi:hypothetical protein
MWLDSLNYSESSVQREISFVLANEKVLLGDLNEQNRQAFIQGIQNRSNDVPVVLRRVFQNFGASTLPSIPLYSTSQSTVFDSLPSTSSRTVLLEALAVVELRGIILKHPKKSTRLLPSEWSHRFKPTLGSFRRFVETKSPSIFNYDYDVETGLICTTLAHDSAEALLRYQRLVDSCSKPLQAGRLFDVPDDQYLGLCRISDLIERYRIAGGKDVYENAQTVLRELARQFPNGVDLSKAHRALTEAGIPPLPLEWFVSILVVPGDNVFTRKDSIDRISAIKGNRVLEGLASMMTQAITGGFPSVSAGEVMSRLSISRPELEEALANSDFFVHEPNKIFSCDSFENLIYGYVSPSTFELYQKSVTLAHMTPVRHLVTTIDKVIDLLPSKRLPTEYFIAWCTALDMDTRLVWRCLRNNFFWSGPQSECQILLRSKAGKIMQDKASIDNIPNDIVQLIKVEIKKLGTNCTLDKLISNLHWGKQSDLTKKYGLLRDVLQRISDIFYDPGHLYKRSGLDAMVVWPEEETDIGTDCDRALDEAEMKFTVLSGLSSLIIHHLSTSGYTYYAVSQAAQILANAGYDQQDIYSLEYLYVPDSIVYLRKTDLIGDVNFPDTSVEWMVISILRNSTRFAVDYDLLIRTLVQSSRFTVMEIDRLRYQLTTECGNVTERGEGLSMFCFFNPNVIILRSVAEENLEMKFANVVQSTPSMIKQKLAYLTDEANSKDVNVPEGYQDSVVTLTSENLPGAPKWCVVGAIVTESEQSDETFVILRLENERALLRSVLNPGDERWADISSVRPKPVRAGDTVKVLDGPYKGSVFHVVGLTGATVSLQVSKFDFKSFPLEDVMGWSANENTRIL